MENSYWNIIVKGYTNYAGYLWQEITHPHWKNYFYWLIMVSLFFLLLEWIKPWRKNQPKFRKDFFLDLFYMFFNFFLFSLIVYNAASDVAVNFFNNLIYRLTQIDLQSMNPLREAPMWIVLIVGFIVRDFVQWWVHRLLHIVPALWRFHKVHHSVEQMGFAAHLRYHWMETVVYRSIEYLPLALLGIGLYDFFIIHIFTLCIGHYNHANISVSSRWTAGVLFFLIGLAIVTESFEIRLLEGYSIGFRIGFMVMLVVVGVGLFSPLMKKVFNSPEMHIWHHAYALPSDRRFGVNYGISLALWDYLFHTAYIPESGKDIQLGFPKMEYFPKKFFGQIFYGFKGDHES